MKLWHLLFIAVLIVSAFFLGRYMIPNTDVYKELKEQQKAWKIKEDSIEKDYEAKLAILRALQNKKDTHHEKEKIVDSVHETIKINDINDPLLDSLIRAIHIRAKERFNN